MSKQVICSLFHLEETARIHRAREMVTLLSDANQIERPPCIDPERHLVLSMNDIAVRKEDMQSPEDGHIRELIAFARDWQRSAPLLIHCWMGISRSTAAAYIVASALDPTLQEKALAEELRRRSPTATPNPRMIALADGLLGRDGRMIAAIDRIGRGTEASHGTPFVLPLEAA